MKRNSMDITILPQRKFIFNGVCKRLNDDIDDINKIIECIGFNIKAFSVNHDIIVDDRFDDKYYVSEINAEYASLTLGDGEVGFSVKHNYDNIDVEDLYKICEFKIYIMLCRNLHKYGGTINTFVQSMNKIICSIDKNEIGLFKLTLFEFFVGDKYKLFSDEFGGDAGVMNMITYLI